MTNLLQVEVDVKPRSAPNCFNNDSHGVIPVPIFGSAEFDVTRIDPSTCYLEGLAVKGAGKSNRYLAHIEDVNEDAYDDPVLQIEDQDGALGEGTTTAILTGNLYKEYGGTPIEGTDSMCIVP